MKKEIIVKDLLKVAKEIVSDSLNVKKYYRVIQDSKDNEYAFEFLYVFNEPYNIQTESTVRYQINQLEEISYDNLIQLQKIFNKEDYVISSKLSKSKEVLVSFKDSILFTNNKIYLNVDISGSGMEYTWDRTIDILKKSGYVLRK